MKAHDDQTRSSAPPHLVMVALPRLQLLDLAGPAQAFHEATDLGIPYRISFAAGTPEIRASQPVTLAGLVPLDEIRPGPGDVVFLPGVDGERLGTDDLAGMGVGFFAWLRDAHDRGATVASVCNAAFHLAYAGLLDGRACTTHWRRVTQLREAYPAVTVHDDRLFVKDGRIHTSAGVTAGIDLALSILEDRHGPELALGVAKELVVYLRRDGHEPQWSAYLEYRNHLDPGIHRVQDRIVNHPEASATVESLAEVAGMSPRNLTRVFRRQTGITIKTYVTAIRMERAAALLRDTHLGVDEVARACGFADARQLRRHWAARFGAPPSSMRGEARPSRPVAPEAR